MKNKIHSIKTLFIRKMGYSAIIQFIVFALILILAKDYFYHNQLNTITENLIINDSFTSDEIGRFHLLGNKYALDLELYNLSNERKLDSIKFVQKDEIDTLKLGVCESFDGDNYKICKSPDSQITGITEIKQDGKILGYVIAQKQYNSILSLPVSYGLLLILLTVLGTFLFNFFFLFLSMRRKIAKSTHLLIDFISSHQANNIADTSKIDIAEYVKIANKFVEEHTEMLVMQKERAYYEVRKNIAEQVAHDIRSPLAAISIAVSDVSSIPENKRIMIKSASKRINDIANNLLAKSKQSAIKSNEDTDDKNVLPELIFTVLDNIVSEKRYEHCETKIDIQFNVNKHAYNCFANIHLVSFKRVLSNLINNSVDAIKSNGIVTLYLTVDTNSITINITDNGCGIPIDILPKITEQGFSYNKENGAGFGLSYAKKYIDKLNGILQVSSEVDVGTKVTINLFRADCPNWFCKELNINESAIIVVLDDDPSIHDAWNDRLNHLNNVRIIHFYKASNLTLEKIHELSADLYLVDYELLMDERNGLDVIEDLNLNKKAVLVSSSFEDLIVRNRCEKLGIKIIPKPYVPYISIQLSNIMLRNERYVLIDDDSIVRSAWKMAAEIAGVTVATYSSPSEFIPQINNYCKNTFIYIDSNLSNDIKGESFAKVLHDQGFTEIHLATGYEPDQFGSMPWVKSIVGKEPPFLP